MTDCDHNNIKMRKLSDTAEEAYCTDCDETIGFRINIEVFGDVIGKKWKAKVEGKPRELDEYEKEELK